MAVKYFLIQLCKGVYRAEENAQAERRVERFGEQFIPELLLLRKDKVRVEIRKENANHNAPHIHVIHSDKLDVSFSLIDFSILAGRIDGKTKKHLLALLIPKKNELNEIWRELNERDSLGVEILIKNLRF